MKQVSYGASMVLQNYMVLNAGKCHFMCLWNNIENETFLFHYHPYGKQQRTKNYWCYNDNKLR